MYLREAVKVATEYTIWDVENVKKAVGVVIELYSQHFNNLNSSGWEEGTEWAMDSTRRIDSMLAVQVPTGLSLLFKGPGYTSTSIDIRTLRGILRGVIEPRLEPIEPTEGAVARGDLEKHFQLRDAISEGVLDGSGLKVLQNPLRFVFPKDEFVEVDYLSTGLLFPKF